MPSHTYRKVKRDTPVDTAFLILDTQINMFDPSEPVYGAQHLLEILQILLVQARASNFLVIYIQNNGGEGDPDQPHTPGWYIHPAIAPQKEDLVFQKTSPDAFYGTTLHQELQSRGIRHLIVAGMQSELCIDTTCRQAVQLGYQVTLVGDAHSTFDSDSVSAEQLIDQTNQELSALAQVKLSRDLFTYPRQT
jgi:nicotinamidase-related amidase